MQHQEAVLIGQEVSEAIKTLEHLYVSIIVKSDGNRIVVIRKKGDHNK